MFKRVSSLISKVLFWFENIIFVGLFALYEFFTIPFVMVKTLWTLFIISPIYQFIFLGLLWLVFGLFYLAIIAIVDIFNFIWVLSDYKDERDLQEIKENEEDL